VHNKAFIHNLDAVDTGLLKSMFEAESTRLFATEDGNADFMAQVENLGHGPSPVFGGLNVELLPFQKQTLQWATKREHTPGGIQSYFWASVLTKDEHAYSNPGSGVVTTKPPLIRGGLLCDAMGFGKVRQHSIHRINLTLPLHQTITSLAIILNNPAPVLPASGIN